MNLVSFLLSTFFAMECLGVSISYNERKSWIRSSRHRRSSSNSECPDCLSQEEQPTSCALEREERRRIARLTRITEYIPICRKDGSYASVQCHPSTRSCWCVTESGRPISGSSVLSTGTTTNRPNCAKYHRMAKSATKRRSSQAKKNRKSCNHADRSRFNVALIKTFRSEYNRLRSLSSSISDLDSNADDIVLSWKFDHLDRNKDTFLQRNETSILKDLVKQQIQPRQCAKTFISFCAKNDKKISKKEWLECLRTSTIDNLPFDTFNSLVDSGSSRHPSQLLRPVGSVSVGGAESSLTLSAKGSETDEVSNCWTDRQSALASQIRNESIIVPECTPTGSYQKTQCAQGKAYCWCVEEDSGVQIPHTIVLNTTPDCDKKGKPMRGCTGLKKQKFLTDLVDILAKRMTSIGDNKRLLEGNSRNGSTLEEQAVRWYFEQLDVNDNGVLDRKEWKILRNETSSDKKLKRCGKKLPRHCDVNQDKKITLSEWLDCLGANKYSETSTGKRPVSRHNGRGKNPFTTILS